MDVTMRKLCGAACWTVGLLTALSGAGLAEPVRMIEKSAARGADLIAAEVDPDAGSEVEMDWIDEGQIAAVETNCTQVGSFTSAFQFTNRYRGNLYRFTAAGVFLKEIKMQLAFEGTANLYVSVHRKLGDGTYVEVDLDLNSPTQAYRVISVQGSGLNTPVFYSTGLLNGQTGIELMPGDYAIGYAWGPESVRYGRNTATYPQPFSDIGTTLASLSRDVGANEPPIPSTIPTFAQFAGGVYAQELCFVPTEGACCLSDGIHSSCDNRLAVDCVGEGSYFHGQRTTCKDTFCEFGACCFACDTPAQNFAAKCRDNYVIQSCQLAGGIAFHPGTSCPGDQALLCPKLVGACCNGVNCNLKCQTECLAGGGTYEGNLSNCNPNTHVCKGACCVTGGCLDRTQAGCAGLNGSFAGRGTRCFSETCGGACCYGFGGLEFCEEVAERELCAYDPNGFPVIAYKGDGTSCFNSQFQLDCGNATAYKACCLPTGECINTTQAVCTASWIQGNYISTSTCAQLAPNQCTNLLSRCCFTDGSCEVLTGNSCAARGGTTVVGQTTCPSGACNSTAGACCGTAVGACTMKTAAQCNAEGGIYQGDNSDCSNATATCPGYGSCCRGSSECLEKKTSVQCATLGGAYAGPGTTCATQNCDQRGACCAITGTCLQLTAGNCASINGSFKGVGVSCGAGVCPSGACCLPEGCRSRTPAACSTGGGQYRGDGTSCSTQNCLIQGACCRGGNCTVETFDQCAVGGTYLGNATTCIQYACTPGACCRINGSCNAVSGIGACDDPGEVYHPEMECASVQCAAQGACCSGDPATCTLTTQAQCGGDYLGDSVQCEVDSCDPTGACCTGTLCIEETAFQCNAVGGQYIGDGVPCAGDTCQVTGPCTSMTAENPGNCAIDARRPYPQNAPGSVEGWNAIELSFDCDTTSHQVSDYQVSVEGVGPAPTVTGIVPNGNSITVTLSGPITPGDWTCVTYVPAGLTRCVGSLPGDISGNRLVAPTDILDLIDNLNGIRPLPLASFQCDVDRSNSCAPADIITLIDLLNGTNGYITWAGKALPACPSLGP